MALKNKLITPGTSLAISLDEFKRHIKWDLSDNSEDILMTSFIQTATTQAEFFTRRALRAGTWKTFMDEFCSKVKMEIAPIDLETLVVKYYDTDNDIQTLSASEYFVHDNGLDDYTEIEFDGTMPTLYDKYNVIEINYKAGYANLPEQIREAIRMQAASYFNNRASEDSQVPGDAILYGFHQLLYPYRLF
jgi:uncharacterized phiE125 gp8 family phage protein